MTRDEIISMARKAGFTTLSINEDLWGPYLERFANLVAAHEREECAKVCDEVGDRDTDTHAYDCAAAIRARGEK